jgi:hypothetical protein
LDFCGALSEAGALTPTHLSAERMIQEAVRDSARSMARFIVVASLTLPAFVIAACGGSDADKRGLGNAAGKSSAGAGGTMAPHIGTGGTGAGGSAARGGGGGAATTGGTGSAARGGTTSGEGGGTDDAAGASGGAREPPGPTDDGLSPYTVLCNESTPCSEPTRVGCLGIVLDDGSKRFTCSSDCNTSRDCSDAPSGTDAKADCVQFTQAKHCVLVCYDSGSEVDCPDGMGCYVYPNAPIGYCLRL